MTATVEQVQSECRRLIEIAQGGEEIVITSQGRAIARLTGVASTASDPLPSRQAWVAELAKLRESTATGKTTPTTEEILDDLRSDRG